MNDREKEGIQDTVAEAQIDDCRAELNDMKNRYLYLNAEFENYKKRMGKEQGAWTEGAQDRVLIDILSTVDDLERAFAELTMQELPQEVSAHFQGISMIVKNLNAFLKKYDIEEISAGGPFDPEIHEAVMQQDSQDHASGDILAILQKGYRRKDRILRPAKVVVAS